MTRRVMGKLAFFTLADETGPIQLFLEKAALGDAVKITSLVDAGDWIGVKGTLRHADRGELSVKAAEWQMLGKSLQPLPDKWLAGGCREALPAALSRSDRFSRYARHLPPAGAVGELHPPLAR